MSKCITGTENMNEPGDDYSGRPTSWLDEIEKARLFGCPSALNKKKIVTGVKYSFKLNKLDSKHLTDKNKDNT